MLRSTGLFLALDELEGSGPPSRSGDGDRGPDVRGLPSDVSGIGPAAGRPGRAIVRRDRSCPAGSAGAVFRRYKRRRGCPNAMGQTHAALSWSPEPAHRLSTRRASLHLGLPASSSRSRMPTHSSSWASRTSIAGAGSYSRTRISRRRWAWCPPIAVTSIGSRRWPAATSLTTSYRTAPSTRSNSRSSSCSTCWGTARFFDRADPGRVVSRLDGTGRRPDRRLGREPVYRGASCGRVGKRQAGCLYRRHRPVPRGARVRRSAAGGSEPSRASSRRSIKPCWIEPPPAMPRAGSGRPPGWATAGAFAAWPRPTRCCSDRARAGPATQLQAGDRRPPDLLREFCQHGVSRPGTALLLADAESTNPCLIRIPATPTGGPEAPPAPLPRSGANSRRGRPLRRGRPGRPLGRTALPDDLPHPGAGAPAVPQSRASPRPTRSTLSCSTS